MLYAALLLASSLPAYADSAALWSLCLELEVAHEARDEPDAALVVAVAFAHCSNREATVRKYLVNGVVAEIGNRKWAEKNGDLLLSAYKIEKTEKLLSRARSAISVSMKNKE